MTPQDILTQFEAAKLLPFHHRDHIHVAWLYLRRDGWDVGYEHIQQGLQHFAFAHKRPHRYHETITRFWAHLVQNAISRQPEIEDFDTFLAQFPYLIDQASLLKHYSQELLQSMEARVSWQEPDLIAMPSLIE